MADDEELQALAACSECGRPARGQVAVSAEAPAHLCRQCSPEHCQIARYIREHPDRWATLGALL